MKPEGQNAQPMLMTEKDVAHEFCVSVRQLQRIKDDPRQGFPAPVYIGKRPRWFREAIRRWADSRTRT